MPNSVQITLRNMQFHVRVGILPHEAEFAQPLEIDLTVWAVRDPDGAMTVDYRALHDIATAAVSRQPLHYLETIAEQIVQGALGLASVRGARVAVRKPHVALPGLLDHAEIVVQDGTCA